MINNSDTTSRYIEEYLDWMYDTVCDKDYVQNLSYRSLFEALYDTDFYPIIPMDSNREEDGVALRYKFGRDKKIPDPEIMHYLDNKPCSVLEMMVALALRMENQIMFNPEYGNRSGQWFWEMIVTMGLGSFSDDRFSKGYYHTIIEKFLERQYSPNGKGGLFEISDPNTDMRNVEIWYQMQYYLSELLDN